MNARLTNSLRLVTWAGALLVILVGVGCVTKPVSATRPISESAAATLPFKLEVVEVSNSTLPGLHSFSAATTGGQWLIIGGRSAGLHGFGSGTNNFPRSTANTNAYVLDPAANRVLGSADLVKALPPSLAGPLTASNPQSVQVGTNVFILGGYGQDLVNGGMTSFGSIIRVDVNGLVQAITNKWPIASYFTQNPIPDNRLKVSGGGLKYHDGIFYLVFGQDFTGHYSIQNRDYNRAGGQFQKYTEKVRVFTLNSDLSIGVFNQIDGGYDHNLPYHRRDLNVLNVIQSDSVTPGATVYGGVFKAGQVAGHTTPIDIIFTNAVTNATFTATNPPFAVLHRTNFNQALSHYDCANITIFDQASRRCYTTLFGGISQYHYNSQSNILVLDQMDLTRGIDGLPFINTISTIQRDANGAFAQFIQPQRLPSLLGTDGQFLPSSALQTKGQVFENGVIKLHALQGRTLIGYLYGGIEAFGPYSSLVTNQPSTRASSRLFQVYVTPGATSVIPMPPLPTQPTPYSSP